MINLPPSSFLAAAPEIILTLGALFVLILDLVMEKEQRVALAGFSIAVLALAAYYVSILWGRSGFYYYDMIVVDNFRLSLAYIILLGSALAILMSIPYLRREEVDHGEYYCLILCATLGMLLMAAATDLLMIFIALETMSVSVYILSAFQRSKATSNEAGMKYLLIGSFATAFLLYGIALTYAATGHTDLDGIRQFIAAHPSADKMLYAGIALLIVGFGFKVAAFPFHLWTPDVYEGAPTSVTAFMAAGVKVAAFAAFARVFISTLDPVREVWVPAIACIAVLTMTLGNFVAVTQTNIKRLLAYSSIAHAGYLMIGLVAGTPEAAGAMVFYLLAYTLMTMGVFAVIVYLGHRGEPNLSIHDFAGLGFRYPLLGAAIIILMASFAGIPPTVGFMSKFYLFNVALKTDVTWLQVNWHLFGWTILKFQANMTWLIVIAVMNSAVSVFYYLGILVRMFMNPPEVEAPALPAYRTVGATLAISIVAILILGVVPGYLMDTAHNSVMVALGLR